MPTWRYITDKDGNPRRQLVSERLKYRGTDTPESLAARVRKAYYHEECTKGSQFRSGFSKAQIKEAWANSSE